MSYQNTIRDVFSITDLSVALAKIGFVFSLALLGLQFFAYQPLLVIIPTAIGSGCLLYLVASKYEATRLQPLTLPRFIAGYLPSFVVVGFAAFVLIVGAAGQRTVPAYFVAGGVGSCILLQILLLEDAQLSRTSILAQVIGAGIIFRLAGLFATPGFVGIDIQIHLPVFVDSIIEEGSLYAISDSKYMVAPVYHSYVAVATLFFGSSRMALYLTLGLLVPVSVLFVYGTGQLLLPERWALLATALYAISDHYLLWGIHIIPTTLGLVFFLVVLYLVTRLFAEGARMWTLGMIFLFSIAVIFTHQVSTMIMLVFLGITTSVALAADFDRNRSIFTRFSRGSFVLAGILLVNIFMTSVMWAVTPHSGDHVFLWRMLEIAEIYFEDTGFLNLATESEVEPPVSPESPTLFEMFIPFIELFGFSLLLCLGVTGGLVMLRWEISNRITFTYLLTTGVFFIVVFGFSFVGFRVVLPGRWFPFLYALLVIITAVGLYYLFQRAPRSVVVAVILVLAIGYPTTMAIAEKATIDNPTFDDQHPRFAFTEPEHQAVETISTIHPPNHSEEIHTDHPYMKLFEEPIYDYESVTLPLDENRPATDAPVIYRDFQSTGPATWSVPDAPPGNMYTRTVDSTVVCNPERDVTYVTDDVQLCLASNVTEER